MTVSTSASGLIEHLVDVLARPERPQQFTRKEIQMRNVIRAAELTVIASPLTGYAAIKAVNMLFEGRCVFLVLGLFEILSFGCLWTFSSMASDWLDAHSQSGLIKFAEKHRWITSIAGQFLVGTTLIGIMCLSPVCRHNMASLFAEQ